MIYAEEQPWLFLPGRVFGSRRKLNQFHGMAVRVAEFIGGRRAAGWRQALRTSLADRPGRIAAQLCVGFVDIADDDCNMLESTIRRVIGWRIAATGRIERKQFDPLPT